MPAATKERVIRRMQQTPVIYKAILQGVTPERARTATDGPNGWSIVEIMSHVYEYEGLFMSRIQQMLTEDKPVFPQLDQAALAKQDRYQDRDFVQMWNGWLERRRAFLDLLKGLTDEQWQRLGVHPLLKEVTVMEMGLNTVVHDIDHLEQITRALGLSEAIV